MGTGEGKKNEEKGTAGIGLVPAPDFAQNCQNYECGYAVIGPLIISEQCPFFNFTLTTSSSWLSFSLNLKNCLETRKCLWKAQEFFQDCSGARPRIKKTWPFFLFRIGLDGTGTKRKCRLFSVPVGAGAEFCQRCRCRPTLISKVRAVPLQSFSHVNHQPDHQRGVVLVDRSDQLVVIRQQVLKQSCRILVANQRLCHCAQRE